MGRVPSQATTMAVPGAGSSRLPKNNSEGLSTSFNPWETISNIPISCVAPKRFFTVLNNLWDAKRSPSKYNTVSTKCSNTLGPAIAPSLVT